MNVAARVDLRPFADAADRIAAAGPRAKYVVELAADVDRALVGYAAQEGQRPETIIAEATRAYLLGDRE